MISSDLPWPLVSGYRIRLYENVRGLSEFADVSLVSFCEDARAEWTAALRASLPAVEVLDPVPLRIHIKDDPILLAAAFARGLLTSRPYKIAKFASADMRSVVENLAGSRSFDVLHVELATLAYAEQYMKQRGGAGCDVVLDEHNVEWQLLDEHSRQNGIGWRRIPVGFEAGRTRRYEANAASAVDLVLTISDDDTSDLLELACDANVHTVPPVASAEGFSGCPASTGSDPTVLFVGQMSWLPNQEAVRWFCENVLPELKSEYPDVRFKVVGGGAPPELADSIRAAGGQPLGYVDDLAEVYRSSTVFAAPFLTGGGVRIKLLEAMREGVPIVTTSAGVRGLATRGGRDLLVADTGLEFARAIGSVLSDDDLHRRLVVAGREYLEANHSRAFAAQRLAMAYGTMRSSRPMGRESTGEWVVETQRMRVESNG